MAFLLYLSVQNILFIVNSKSTKETNYIKAIDALHSLTKYSVDIKITQYEKHAHEIASTNSSNYNVVIAVGGDGTIHEVVNGILCNRNVPKLGFIPCGTGNDLSRMFKAFNLNTFVEALEQSNYKSLDLIEIVDLNKCIYGVNAMDIGFGAAVVQKMSNNKTRALSYARAILKTFFSYKAKEYTFEHRGKIYTRKTLMLVISNGRFFGNGLIISPDSALDDGQLEIVHIGNVSLWEYIKNLGRLKKGKRINHKEVSYDRLDSLTILNEGSIDAEVDGEWYQFIKPTIQLSSRKIEVINP